MNKLIFSLAALMLLLTASCEKQQPLNPSGTGLTSGAGNDTPEEEWGLNWWWKEHRGICWPYPLDCFDEVVVTISTYVDDFESAISGGASGVADYFTNGSWEHLFPDLGNDAFADQLSALRSGNYAITTRDLDNMFHYLVTPVGLTTPEFILRVDKSQL